jgi:hypothetical protein
MLRRRLDLQYPNQRASVYVADAASAQPDWKEAGTWYTAGGNTVVFGDPRVIPDANRKQHVELSPPAHVVQTSNRRWRDDEFLLPTSLTRGLSYLPKVSIACPPRSNERLQRDSIGRSSFAHATHAQVGHTPGQPPTREWATPSILARSRRA